MRFAENYLKQNTYTHLEIKRAPSGLLRYVVIIPAFSEPDIFKTLDSLKNCIPPRGKVEVIIIVNYSETDPDSVKEENEIICKRLITWSENNVLPWISFLPVLADNLPRKHAGVGLARKIAMDLAIARFSKLNSPNGIIFSLDADTLVPSSYFTRVEKHIASNPKTNCFIFNFHHPNKGNEHNVDIYTAVTLYEIHLRYYRQMLRSTGFPYYNFTVGSCFAVSAENYVKHGGMSKRKAGEDFYFLLKIFPNSHTAFLKDVVLTPSARPSRRVPFGTGPAIRKMLASGSPVFFTYHPQLFKELKEFVEQVPDLYIKNKNEISSIISNCANSIKGFLEQNNWSIRIEEIKTNSSTLETFQKRFFNWFDSFQVIKFLNFASKELRPTINILEAVKELPGLDRNEDNSPGTILNILRDMD